MERKPPRPEPARDASKNEREEAVDSKATRYDGNPNPKGAPDDIFEPKDDTPLWLEKKKKP